MKKILILSILLMGSTALAIDVSMPVGTMLNDLGGMQNTNSQLLSRTVTTRFYGPPKVRNTGR